MEHDQNSPEAEPLPAPSRRDGWTPFARRLFLEVLAETGRVSRACEYAQLTKQSAYALRARDPLFAASWDAACELARAPLADALYERALDGVTETITPGRRGRRRASPPRQPPVDRRPPPPRQALRPRCRARLGPPPHPPPLGRMADPRRPRRRAGRPSPPGKRAPRSIWSTSPR